MGLDDLKKNLDHKCDCGKKDCEKCNNKRKFNKFSDWIAPIGLTEQDIEELRLIYGVANTEGEMKRGEIMEANNVIAATGAMAASAFYGYADIDIDHYPDADSLPEEYLKKYGKEIADVYPPAFIVDAQASQNDVNGKKLYQSEFWGACPNDHVYRMIKEGKFKGCSVVDYYRRDDCAKCSGDEEGSCTCTVEGSMFLYNTLILDEVPNSHGTWVAAVTKDNIADLFDFSDDETVINFKNKLNAIREKRQKRKAKHATVKSELEEYKTTEGWIDDNSAQEFLEKEKGIKSELAADIAKYITDHPDALNDYQLEYLSMEDIIAWYDALQGKKNAQESRRKLAAKNYLIKNASDLKELSELNTMFDKFVPFGQGEVDYMGSAENQCQKCRFFVESNDGIGDCVIVAGEVAASGGCKKWDEAPGMDPEETPTDNPDDEPEEIEPNADGTCPEGYEINADGTMCVKVDTPSEDPEDPEDPEMDKHKHKLTLKDLRKNLNAKPQITIEQNPSDNTKALQELDKQIEHIKHQITLASHVMPGKNSKYEQSRLEDLRVELKRLESLKKKSLLE